jgi:hypothetical protein
LRGQKLRFSCHSERSEESLPSTSQAKRFFTPLRSVQNDTTCTSGEEKRNSCPWAVYLAEHLEGGSHDGVNDMLYRKRFRPREVWQLVKGRIEDSKDTVLIVDDGSVHDKRYSQFIELVRAQ